MKFYPNHKWKQIKGFKSKKTQQYLKHLIQQFLFHNLRIEEDYQEKDLRYSKSNRPFEFDIYIPSLKLGFEYQGEQHFNFNHIYTPSLQYSENDEEKQNKCKQHGIILIIISYKWNKTITNLIEIIENQLKKNNNKLNRYNK